MDLVCLLRFETYLNPVYSLLSQYQFQKQNNAVRAFRMDKTFFLYRVQEINASIIWFHFHANFKDWSTKQPEPSEIVNKCVKRK